MRQIQFSTTGSNSAICIKSGVFNTTGNGHPVQTC